MAIALAEVSNYSPKEWQPEAIKNLLRNKYHILADDMGLGKTFEFLASALILQERTVIQCPAYLKYVWHNEIEAVCKRPQDKDLFRVTSYSKAKDLLQILEDHKATRLGFDESHYLKNMEAKRTIYTFEAIAEYGIDSITLMSGTPIKNRISEWYSQLRLIHWHLETDFLEKFSTEWAFSVYFCFERSFQVKGKKGSRRVTQFYGLRPERKKELLSYVRPIMTRRLAKDVLGLKEPNFFHINADISDQFDEDLVDAFENGKDSTAKRKSAIAKIPFTSKFVGDLLETSGGPIVIFSDHPTVCEELHKKHPKSAMIIGDTPIKDRPEIVRRFQAKEFDFLFCTIGAASAGHTMTAANIMVFNDMAVVAGDNDQAVRRISRLGQEKPCLIYCIGGSKIDTNISKGLEQKIKDLKKGM